MKEPAQPQQTRADASVATGDNQPAKTRVFISYSRVDSSFAEKLRDHLNGDGCEACLDVHDIAKGESWRTRLQGLIERSDTVMFLISPDSVKSEICDWEVNQAELLGKRILPIVCRATEDQDIPQRLRRLNFTFLHIKEEYKKEYSKLLVALRQDVDWVREHTRLGGLARRWHSKGRQSRILLHGGDIASAETWRDNRTTSAPTISSLHTDFISASRQSSTQRMHLWVIGSVVFAVLVTGLTIWALINRNTAIQERDSARARQLSAQSQSIADTWPQRSQLLAVEAAKLDLKINELSDATVSQALRDAITSAHGTPLNGGGGEVLDIAFGPSGEWLASGTSTGVVRLWPITDPELKPIPLAVHPQGITSLAFDLTGRYLAAASATRLQVWDLNDAERSSVEIPLKGFSEVQTVAFPEKGLVIALGTSERWPPVGPGVVWRFGEAVMPGNPKHEDYGQMYFDQTKASPDARWIALQRTSREVGYGFSLVSLKDRRSARFEERFRENEELKHLPAFPVAFSGNGSLAVSSSYSSARINRASKPMLLWHLNEQVLSPIEMGRSKGWQPLALNHDSSLLLATRDGALALWRTDASDAEPKLIPGRFDSFSGVAAFSAGSIYLAATGRENDAPQLWNLSESTQKVTRLTGHEGKINTIAFSELGDYLATAGADGDIRLRTLSRLFNEPYGFPVHKKLVSALVISPNDHWMASASWDGSIKLFELGDKPQLRTLNEGKESAGDAVFQLAFSGDSRWLASAESGGLTRIWDMSDPNKAPTQRKDHHQQVLAIALSKGGRYLASGGHDRQVKLIDLDQVDTEAVVLPVHDQSVHALDFSEDGKWLLGVGEYKQVTLWDLANELSPHSLTGHESIIEGAAISANGRWVAAWAWDAVTLWDISAQPFESHRLSTTTKKSGGVSKNTGNGAFSHNSRWFALGHSNGTLTIWDLHSLDSEPRQAIAQPSWVSSVSFSCDDRLLATFGGDEGIRLWRIDALDEGAETLRGHHAKHVLEVAWSCDNRWIASGGLDGKINLWSYSTPSLVQTACSAAGRNLSLIEWNRNFPTAEAYRKTCDDLPVHPSVFSEADRLAREGKLSESIDMYEYLAVLGRELNLDAEKSALIGYATFLVKESMVLANRGAIEDAIDAISKAQEYDLSIAIPGRVWFGLCRQGLRHGYAELITGACTNAAEDNTCGISYLEAHALGMALRGELGKAAQAIDQYLSKVYTTDEEKDLLVEWKNQLVLGKNPLTSDKVREFLDQPYSFPMKHCW